MDARKPYLAVLRLGESYLPVDRWEQAVGFRFDEAWLFGDFTTTPAAKRLLDALMPVAGSFQALIHFMPLPRPDLRGCLTLTKP